MKLKIKVNDCEIVWTCWFPLFWDWKKMGKNIEELVDMLDKKTSHKRRKTQ